MKAVIVMLLMAAMLSLGAAPASAEWIQHPMTGEYWWCDWYQDSLYNRSMYWCYVPSHDIWFHAKYGWQNDPHAIGG